MQRRFSLLTLFLVLLIATTASAQTTFRAVLTPGQETGAPVASSGFGTMTAVLDPTHTQLTVDTRFSRLTGNIIGAHIHGKAPAGSPAGVVLDLNPGTNLSGNRISGTFTIPQALGDAIAAEPHLYYINLHTPSFPQGEIRGQLATTSGTITYAGELRGSNEVPPNNSQAVGAFFITLDGNNMMTYEINIGSLANATRAHIHQAEAGVNGNIVVNFTDSPGDFQNGRLRGQINVSGLTPAQQAAIRGNPAGFYVNVHTTGLPGGEIRGQLSFANEYDVPVAGKVSNAFGQNFVTDVRIFNPSFDQNAVVLIEYFVGGGSPTAASSIPLQVRPRGTAVLNDIAGGTFLNQAGTVGALRVSSASRLVVNSRIYNDQRAAGNGTIGQFVPAKTRSQALLSGALPNLSYRAVDPANPTGSRTNIGLFNPNLVTVNVRLVAYDPNGTELASRELTLPPMQQQQLSIVDYFNNNVAAVTRDDLTVTFTANAPIFAYGSVVDNKSSDQIFVSADEDVGVVTTP